MRVITSREMAALDANCEYFGLSRLQLMENAGAGLAGVVRQRYSEDMPVTVVAGRGNNGGDAFVAARHLGGYEVRVFLLGRGSEIKTLEARRNWEVLQRTGVYTVEITDSTQIPEIEEGVVIDAIFGTGIKGRLRPLESGAIDRINESDADIVSIDVPSGLDPDTGGFDKAVKADLTVTFHRPKPALVREELKEYTGEVITVPIGIPEFFEHLVGPGDLLKLPRRKPESHKGYAGRILVIGGGPYSGAPALCAMAALRCGADLVRVAVPSSVSDTVASFSPNLIVTPLCDDYLNTEDLPLIKKMISESDVVVLGMGLGRHPDTQFALREIIPMCPRAVVDADGLYGLDFEEKNYSDIIITPHSGEFNRITGLKLPVDLAGQMKLVGEFAADNRLTVLLKGKRDIISKDGVVRLNVSGNSGMSVGGTGDVLAGITAALYATCDALTSACCAAFISGRAGDLCYEKYGNGLLATDIIEAIPEAMKI
jgi:NAD(P)H-hydrate epimerase